MPGNDAFPPRGSGRAGRVETAPAASWADPAQLPDEWTWKPGRLCFGKWGERFYGLADNRHVVTIAGSRSGKTATLLVPNLRDYPGPVLAIDPKGELVADTAEARKRFGPVHVLDPFGITGRRSSAHNSFAELRRSSPQNAAADAAQIADALIVDANDAHWTDSAKNLIKGLVLHLLATEPEQATMRRLRVLLNETPIEFGAVLLQMTDNPDAFDGALANIGAAFLSLMDTDDDGKPIAFGREFKSILSTARQQTGPLDDIASVTDSSDFSLADIGRKNLTIYLVLPAGRLGTHYRWLRLFLMQALVAMEANPIAREAHPAWFVLEEFAALGRLQAIEMAAGYIAGFGVRLLVILQDLTQLQAHYPKSFETFLGNAGQWICFDNVDVTTTEYLSKKLGQTTITQIQRGRVGSDFGRNDGVQENLRAVPLLAPDEISFHFARRLGRLFIVTSDRPVYLERLPIHGELPK